MYKDTSFMMMHDSLAGHASGNVPTQDGAQGKNSACAKCDGGAPACWPVLDRARWPDGVLAPGGQRAAVLLLVRHAVRGQAARCLMVQLVASAANPSAQDDIMEVIAVNFCADTM